MLMLVRKCAIRKLRWMEVENFRTVASYEIAYQQAADTDEIRVVLFACMIYATMYKHDTTLDSA